ncbi:hypothetical protein [Vibrio paucivorans]|uniref:Glycosyltransferase n=1 Tax=Vibrio paucivorans TaxID=2829489 RepID=A0A9X3CDF1_9VIBR|nr:hypothetical protein [Vibrio paucivorans]MCW8333622.1 glycosyltransferase [Vibrio paucivorans]
MPNYTIAISTLNDGISKIKLPNVNDFDSFHFLIIHQVTDTGTDYGEHYKRLKNVSNDINIHTSHEMGLSRSRNLAIDLCQTDYIVFSDDDNGYIENLKVTLDTGLIDNDFPELISFMISDVDGNLFKAYPSNKFSHTRRSILRLSSIENVVNIDFLRRNNIRFNEEFGLGSTYPSCEQGIFGNDILKHSGRCLFIPEVIAIHPLENSGLDFYEPQNALTRKKMLINVFGFGGYFYTLMFFLVKLRKVPRKKVFGFIYGLFFK